jgi:integration host factor subunit beta
VRQHLGAHFDCQTNSIPLEGSLRKRGTFWLFTTLWSVSASKVANDFHHPLASIATIFAIIPSIINKKNGFSCGQQPSLSTKGTHTMTKADLVDQVTAIGDLTRRDGEVIVDTLFDAVIGALKSGDKIEIRGFGSFRTRQRNARTGRNPKTGAKVDVPAKRVPFFKPSKELRDSVNPNGAVKSKAVAKKADTEHVDPHHPPAM